MIQSNFIVNFSVHFRILDNPLYIRSTNIRSLVLVITSTGLILVQSPSLLINSCGYCDGVH